MEHWSEDALNDLTDEIARSTGGRLRWEALRTSLLGSKMFLAEVHRGAAVRLQKVGDTWRATYLSTTGRKSTLAEGSQREVIKRSLVFKARDEWAVREVCWEQTGNQQMRGYHPHWLQQPAMILVKRADSMASLFCVDRVNPETWFSQDVDRTYNDQICHASLLLYNADLTKPRPPVLFVNHREVACTLDLGKMQVEASCAFGRFEIVYNAPNRYTLWFTARDTTIYVLGQGSIADLYERHWTVPQRGMTDDDDDDDDDAENDDAEDDDDDAEDDGEDDDYDYDDDDAEDDGEEEDYDDDDEDDDIAGRGPTDQRGKATPRPTREQCDALVTSIVHECHRWGLKMGSARDEPLARSIIDRVIDAEIERTGLILAPSARTLAVTRLLKHFMATDDSSAGQDLNAPSESDEADSTIVASPEDHAAHRDLLDHHLRDLADTLPSGVNGASTARRYIEGFKRAIAAGVGDVSGNYNEVAAALGPFMDRVASLRSTTDAFALLELRTPLLVRIHSRCWEVRLGQARDPQSAVAAELRRLRG